MRPDIPILMIALQIPVLDDTTTEQILEVIAEQVHQALLAIRQEQAASGEPESIPPAEFNEWVIKERLEPYSDKTRKDLLAALGYKSDV